MALVGDSSAAGYGVERVEDTPGARLASGLAESGDRRVYLREATRVGAQSSDLDAQLDVVLAVEPDVAVILVGANDVTHTVRPSESVRFLGEAVRPAAAGGGRGGGRHLSRPRHGQAARAAAAPGRPGLLRRLAAAQTIATVEAGGPYRLPGSILGPDFDAEPALYFGPDRFHPSAQGYASMVQVLLPSVLDALALAPDDEVRPEAYRGEGRAAGRRRGGRGHAHARHRGRRHRGGRGRAGVRGRWRSCATRRRQPQGDADAPRANRRAAPDPGERR